MRTPTEACTFHQEPKSMVCINCRQNICRLCRYYTINSRVWCSSCAVQHLPKQAGGTDVGGNMKAIAKFFGLLVSAGAPLLIFPGGMAKIGITGVSVGLYLWFVVFKDFGASKIAIDEVVDGKRRQISG